MSKCYIFERLGYSSVIEYPLLKEIDSINHQAESSNIIPINNDIKKIPLDSNCQPLYLLKQMHNKM